MLSNQRKETEKGKPLFDRNNAIPIPELSADQIIFSNVLTPRADGEGHHKLHNPILTKADALDGRMLSKQRKETEKGKPLFDRDDAIGGSGPKNQSDPSKLFFRARSMHFLAPRSNHWSQPLRVGRRG
jgi:hypothetical protein